MGSPIKKWRRYEYSDCPNCGSSLDILSDDNFWSHEKDMIRCHEECGFRSSIGLGDDEIGRVFVKDGNIGKLIKKNIILCQHHQQKK